MTTTSNPSTPVFSIKIPNVVNLEANFVYNFYVKDESVNPAPNVPDVYKQSLITGTSLEATENAAFTARVPRFVKIKWRSAPVERKNSNYKPNILRNLEKLVTEEKFADSAYVPYVFSGDNSIEDAFRDINNDGKLDLGTSQAGNIDSYVNKLVGSFNVDSELKKMDSYKKKVADAVKNIELLSDNPTQTLGLKFLDPQGNQIKNFSGFDQVVSNSESLLTQINSLVLSDIFISSSMPENLRSDYNNYQKKGQERKPFNPNNATVEPIEIIPVAAGTRVVPDETSSYVNVVGYIVEKFEKTINGSFIKRETFTFDDVFVGGFNDINVKYGATYFYSIRSVAVVTTPAVDDSNQIPEITNIRYLVASRPKVVKVFCSEAIPPPAPTDIYFNWNYYEKKLTISWATPSNPQRDIKQFQVFRRKTINEPFELIAQKSFDDSAVKYLTGEVIDGNRVDLVASQEALVERTQSMVTFHVDPDFKTDIEYLEASKYIYAIASIDAHGIASGYSKQYEISFDFFKNALTKKIVSSVEAPRPYPNLYLESDLFKDVIKTSGESSMMMKVYFVPEYFKVVDSEGKIQKLVSTVQDGASYKMQFINTQNQKTDSLTIRINDPNGLTNI